MTSTAGEIALLGIAVAGILLALTLTSEALRARAPQERPLPGVDSFAARVRGWWAMAVLFALALLLGRAGVVLVFALTAFAALRQVATYTAKAREDHTALALAFFAVLPLQFLFVGLGYPGVFTIFIPVYVFAGLSVLSALRGSPARFLARVAETQWALMICVYGASHVPALMTLDLRGAPSGGVLLIPFLIMAVQGGEVAETVAGRRFDGRPIAPALSPRSWRGAGAGVGVAGLIGAVLAWLTPFGLLGAALMAAIASAAGLAGTLVLAAIKRERGVKDWSHVIPGQGGVLDQLGGVFFAAPLFYHLTHYGWA
jgi:phosphatidate cytidylyltransferase